MNASFNDHEQTQVIPMPDRTASDMSAEQAKILDTPLDQPLIKEPLQLMEELIEAADRHELLYLVDLPDDWQALPPKEIYALYKVLFNKIKKGIQEAKALASTNNSYASSKSNPYAGMRTKGELLLAKQALEQEFLSSAAGTRNSLTRDGEELALLAQLHLINWIFGERTYFSDAIKQLPSNP